MSGELDQLVIEDLEVYAVIGVHEWERLTKQQLKFTIRLVLDTTVAGQSDELTDSVDYRALTKEIIEFVEQSKFKLLEKLAEEVASICMTRPNLKAVEVELSKPRALRYAQNVGIKIKRTRR